MTEKVLIAVLLGLCSAGCWTSPSAEHALLGVWQIQKIESTGSAGTSINENPLPSLAVFTRSHYSLAWMPGTTGMRGFNERWVPTDEEMIQRYGEIIVNSGTYTRTDSEITARPVVSRVPEFMGGGRMVYEYRVDGDTLWLTSLDEYSFDGIQAPWAAAGSRKTLTLKKVEDL